MSPAPYCGADDCQRSIPRRTGCDAVLWVEVDMGRCWPTRPDWTRGWGLGEGRQVLYVEWRAMQRRRSRVIVVRSVVIISFFSRRVQSRFSSRRQLIFPAVPASLPAEFTNLTELESIEVVGGGNTPGMALRDLSCRVMYLLLSCCSWLIPD
jgi:hypothetical protein